MLTLFPKVAKFCTYCFYNQIFLKELIEIAPGNRTKNSLHVLWITCGRGRDKKEKKK